MDKWFIGFVVISVAILGLIATISLAGFIGIKGEFDQLQQEKQAELFLKEQVDMNAINIQIGQMQAINSINTQFFQNNGRIALPIFDANQNAFVDVPFLTEGECAQIIQENAVGEEE